MKTCINCNKAPATRTDSYCKPCGNIHKRVGLALIPATKSAESNGVYVVSNGWTRDKR